MDLRARQATDDNMPHREFLFHLLHDEVERREAKQLHLRLRRASFDSEKTLEDFDFAFNPQVPKGKVVDLATCNFIERQGERLAGRTDRRRQVAPCPGARSSGMPSRPHRPLHVRPRDPDQAAGITGRPELRPAHWLVSQDAAPADHRRPRPPRPLENDEPIDLYEVIRQRYERGAMIITSNRALEEWPPLFVDELLASAAMDRVMHHAHVVVIEGRSFRQPKSASGGSV